MMGDAKSAVLEVWLLEPISRVKGRSWPTYDDGRPLEMTAREEPCQLVIHLPSGREYRMAAKAVTMDQEGGVVTQVSVMPLMDVVPFRTAAAEVRRIAADLKAETDERLRLQLEDWQHQDPAPDGYSSTVYMTKTRLEKRVLLYLQIKVRHERGWFVVVDFTRPAQGDNG